MTRVSTLAQNQLIFRSTQLTQQRLFDLQRQASSGERADTFKLLGGDGFVLTTAKSRAARLDHIMKSNIQTKTRLDLRERAVNEIVDIAKDVKAAYLKAEGGFDATYLQSEAQDMMERVFALLNSRDQNGNYLFAGSRTDTAPVSFTLNGAPPPHYTVTYNNDTLIEQANIDDNLTVQIGVLAASNPTAPSGTFQPLIDILNHFAAGYYPPPYAATALPPPIPASPTPDLITPLIDQAFDQINQLDGELGIKQKLLDEANERMRFDLDLTNEFITQVKDVDMAEAVVELSQAQTALEATFRVTGELRGLSLVNFL